MIAEGFLSFLHINRSCGNSLEALRLVAPNESTHNLSFSGEIINIVC